MAVIALNSPKGGVAKTTLAILLASEFAHLGQSVKLLDADPNQHSFNFGRGADIAGLEFVGPVTDASVMQDIKHAKETADVVILDLPGATTTLNLKALVRSDFIILPCQTSKPDVMDAGKGIAQIKEASEMRGDTSDPIPFALLWTRIPSSFESTPARKVREQLVQTGVPIFETMLHERAIYKELHLTNKTPRQKDPNSAATQEVNKITLELWHRLAKLREAA